MIKLNPLGACTALALLISLTPTLPASAQVGGAVAKVGGAVGGAVGAVGGVASGAGGTVGGAVGGGVSGTLGGGAGIGSGAAGVAGGVLGGASGALGQRSFSGPSGTFTGFGSSPSTFAFGGAPPVMGGTALPASLLEVRQHVAGKLVALSATSVTVDQADGKSKTYLLAGNMAATLRAFVGEAVSLRSADGIHITSIVGKNDVIRGIVTAVQQNYVTFVSPNGEIHTMQLSGNGAASLGVRVGARVLSVSHDFGKTARLAVLGIGGREALSNVYLGTVANITGNLVTLGLGDMQQQFRIDSRMHAVLAGLRGHTVAAVIPDGINVKSLLMSSTLMNLVATLHSGARLPAAGVKAVALATGRDRLTLQLPNGDIASYVGNINYLNLRARVPVTITPLDRFHVRIKAGAHVATLADANACVTVNAHCRGDMSGNVIAVAPTALSVRLGNGDTETLLGNVLPLGLNAGVPITVTPLDAVHARVLAGARVADLVDAHACVTVNAGCDAIPGTVVGTGPASISVSLPDGQIANLSGNPAPLSVSVNVPVIVQPLDSTHAVVVANGQAVQLADAHLCVTLNADCNNASGGNVLPTGGVLATGSGAVSAAQSAASGAACVAILNNGCTARAGGGNNNGGGNSNGGGANNNGGGANNNGGGANNGGSPDVGGGGKDNSRNDIAGAGLGANPFQQSEGQYYEATVPQMLAALGSPAPCSGDGQIVVNVADQSSTQPVRGARVQLLGSTAPHWVSGTDGSVHFMRLSTGTYRVVVSKPGYKDITSPPFKVDCTQASAVGVHLASSARHGVSAASMSRAPRITPASIRLVSERRSTCITHHYVRQAVSYVHRIRRVVHTRHTRYLCH